MPKLSSFYVEIKTGEHGRGDVPVFAINGFNLPFDDVQGDCQPGSTLKATGNPESFPHALHLVGPGEGQWDIEELKITYFPQGETPYSMVFGAATLDDESNLNIWKRRPAPAFDV